jgi:hypothetical protein
MAVGSVKSQYFVDVRALPGATKKNPTFAIPVLASRATDHLGGELKKLNS